MIMIIVMMMMNMVMKMSNVWSARPGHSLPAGPCESLVCGQLRTKIRGRSQTNPPIPLLAAIRRLLRLKWHICGALNGTFVALSLTQFELQPNFHMYIYIYVQYTYYQ